jgi:hypothetical protein
MLEDVRPSIPRLGSIDEVATTAVTSVRLRDRKSQHPHSEAVEHVLLETR